MGSEWTQCSNIVCSGPYTAPYRRFTSDRIIRNGDLVIIDIGAGYNGYWGDLTRTWVCGNVKPTPEMRDLHQKCYNALFNAGSKVRPGATNAEVFAAADPYVLDSLGHGSGVNPVGGALFQPGVEGCARGAEGRHGVQPRALRGKAGIGGIRLENDHIVTADGVDIYTTYPFDERLVNDLHPLDTTTGRTR